MNKEILKLIVAILFFPTLLFIDWIAIDVIFYIREKKVNRTNRKNKGFTYDNETGKIK